MTALRLIGVTESLAGLFSGDLGTFFARFGKADSDGLFAALYAPALAALAGTQGAALSPTHGAGDGLARSYCTCDATLIFWLPLFPPVD